MSSESKSPSDGEPSKLGRRDAFEQRQTLSGTYPAVSGGGGVRRIAEIRVKGLFHCYDHHIEMQTQDRVTIIHGPNGAGKTCILKMLAALFGGDLLSFFNVPFNTFSLTFEDATELTLAYQNSGYRKAEITLKSPTAETQQVAFPLSDLEPDSESRAPELPGWLSQIRKSVIIRVIEAQRLMRRNLRQNGSSMALAVEENSTDLKARIKQALADYAGVSQSLDQSFPKRLLTSSGSLTVADLRTRMQALDELRLGLTAIGLLQDDGGAPSLLEPGTADQELENNLRVLTLYVEDAEHKLQVLSPIAERIKLLLENLNAKFHQKTIHIDGKAGIVAKDGEGKSFKLDCLSSGEQHELVMLYDLLFNVVPNTLVLLDEPELSLHVVWQKRFLTDLLNIAKTANFDALVATHSPFIVGDRDDLMVELTA
jgi:ABC-type transport system involved in cytochrome c biogenesis ATPase subunit